MNAEEAGGFPDSIIQTFCPPPGLSFRLQSLNQFHQRAVDLLVDVLEAVFQPFKGRPSLPLRLAGLDDGCELVVTGIGPVMRRAALR
jgi:hypothetical protein